MPLRSIPWYTNVTKHQSSRKGNVAVLFQGDVVVDGDAYPWKDVSIGSVYIYRTDGLHIDYRKCEDNGADADWVYRGCVSETMAFGDFTDGGSTSGTFTMTADIPIGAFATRTTLREITGFAGDTSATITVGDGSDVDRYNTGTPNVFATAEMIAAGAVSGTAEHIAAVSPVVTITSGSDWGAVTAGQVTVTIWFEGVA